MRGGDAHDLTVKERRDTLLQRVLNGVFGITIATPPCSNHTRAVFANAQGGRPTRDFFYPEGFLNLAPWEKAKTEIANALIAFSLEILTAAAAADAIGFLEFPEDLGATARGAPASIWQLPQARALQKLGYQRGAFYQVQWAKLSYRKPTGVCEPDKQSMYGKY